MSLQLYSLCSVGDCGDQKRWLMTGERQTLYSKNTVKRMRESSGPSTSLSFPGKIMEKTLLEDIPSHMKNKIREREQPVWIYQGQIMPDQPKCLLL